MICPISRPLSSAVGKAMARSSAVHPNSTHHISQNASQFSSSKKQQKIRQAKEKVARLKLEAEGKYPAVKCVEKGPEQWCVVWPRLFDSFDPNTIAQWVGFMFKLLGKYSGGVEAKLRGFNHMIESNVKRIQAEKETELIKLLKSAILRDNEGEDIKSLRSQHKDEVARIDKAGSKLSKFRNQRRRYRDIEFHSEMNEKQKLDELGYQYNYTYLSKESQSRLMEFELQFKTMSPPFMMFKEGNRGLSCYPTIIPLVDSTISIPLTKNTVRKVKRGQMVVVVALMKPLLKETPSCYRYSMFVAKRLVALEGDVVEYQGEKYMIPEDHCWVLGDNPEESIDSRHFGAVPLQNLRSLTLYTFRLDPFTFKSLTWDK